MELRERIAVVTGASSGIGRATAVALARRGAVVMAVARREDRLRELVAAFEADSPKSGYLAGDLAERRFAEGVVQETLARHGRIDVLVNNAGRPLRRSAYELTPDEVEEVLRVNFLSLVWTTCAALPHMVRQGGGAIVNVSSFATKVVPSHEAGYASSKAAINGFTEGLWTDLEGSGIQVSLVHPGPIETEIWHQPAQHRSGYRGVRHPPEIVADAIVDVIEKPRFEVVVPRRSPQLVLARLIRLIAPGLVRRGVLRMDPVSRETAAVASIRAEEDRSH